MMMKKFFKRYTPLQIAMHIYAWSALVRLIIDFFNHNLTANPIQALEQRTGRHAITLLVLSLACTPLNTIFKWSELLKRRRALGLYAFLYATIHVIIFVDLDYGLAWSLILETIVQKPYIIVGMISFLMLIPLAFTSFDIWKVRLRKNWKRLHQTIYLIIPLVVFYGIIAAILLILRIPPVRRFFASLRDRILLPFYRRRIQNEV